LKVANDLIDDKILMSVKLIPKILEVESYQKTLKHLNKLCLGTNRELHTVTYDWRDDFHASIKKIAKKISSMTKSGEKIEIVAHSNGGILLAYYLRYGAQDFDDAIENWEGLSKISKLSIVASPLFGAYSLFKHIKDGTPVLKNKKLMSSLDYTSFRSTYFFLPTKEFQKGFLEKKGTEFVNINLFDQKNWIANKWGPYQETHQKELPVNDQKFKLLLGRSKKFQALLHAKVENKPQEQVDIQVVQAIGRPTYFYPTFYNVGNIEKYHYPKFDRVDGDGVVASVSSKPLEWFKLFNLEYKVIKAEHLKVISDFKHQKVIHEFLLK
jgi:hypothetical protein